MSETQRKVLRILARRPNMHEQLSGNGCAPLMAAAGALVRKGVIRRGDSSHYFVLKHAQQYALDILAEYRAERAAQKRQEQDKQGDVS